MSSNIVLIGFMGSGKSTIGRLLSKKTDKYFIDTDAMIEARESMKIRDIFSASGENSFRQMENEIATWLSTSVNNAVISTGGGMPTTVDFLTNIGKVVYLEIGFENLLERLKCEEFEKRPLFENIDFAKKIFESREPIYKKYAQLTLDATMTPEEICRSILS